MQLVKKYSISIVDTDDLVLLHEGISNYTAEYMHLRISSYLWVNILCFLMALGLYNNYMHRDQGAVSIRKTVLPGMAIPMLKIRRPNGRLIFNMEIAIRR